MISGIWDNEYVLKLGIKDHINEIKLINDEIIRIKNSTEIKDTSICNEHLDNELADLYLMLEKYFEDKKVIVYSRESKFKEKSENENQRK